jgi:hypothetical protein
MMTASALTKRGLASALAAAVSLAAIPPAWGRQSLAVSPMACQPRAADRAKVDLAFDKGIFNTSTSATARVFCPIQTTEQRSQSEVRRDAVVWVIDNNSSVDFNCKLVFTVNGGIPAGSISTYQLTKNLVDGNRARYAVANPGLNSAIYDSLHINCTIPPNTAAGTSSIMNLYWFTTTNP